MVIIDKNIGFLGGLDICYGRYDIWEHNLFGSNNMYPGIHYNNTR
jgi:phospholipase D1/2